MTIFPFSSTVTLPNGILESSTVLTCGIPPPPYVIKTTWINPTGEVLEMGKEPPNYSINEGFLIIDTRLIIGSTLQIKNLSYKDAGTYRCVAERAERTDSDIRAAATMQLNLLGMLTIFLLLFSI